jgi:hypothetical protein
MLSMMKSIAVSVVIKKITLDSNNCYSIDFGMLAACNYLPKNFQVIEATWFVDHVRLL